MEISFTICSNNYLAQARVLFDSLKKFAPDHKLIVGLVDIKSKEIDYPNFLNEIEVIEVKDIGIPDFDELASKFDIIELNTAVKPFFFKFFLKKFTQVSQIIYFDPDIKLFHAIDYLSKKLENFDILLTPHVLSPIPLDNQNPGESLFLNYGIFNLGFIAVKRSDNVTRFLDWWGERTHNFGFSRVCEGLFVDQLWINHVPVFFEHICVLREPGFNAAPWNLHERYFTVSDNEITVNNSLLYFYHFSSYNPNKIGVPFNVDSYGRFGFENRNDIKPLYQKYHQELLGNNFFFISSIKCVYVELRRIEMRERERMEMIRLKKRNFGIWFIKTQTPAGIKKVLRKILAAVFF